MKTVLGAVVGGGEKTSRKITRRLAEGSTIVLEKGKTGGQTRIRTEKPTNGGRKKCLEGKKTKVEKTRTEKKK